MEIRINELDLTRAGIISVQRELLLGETSWETEYTVGEVMYKVTGSAFHGRPRGRDADVLLALQTFFFRSGCPDSNTIDLSASQILALSGHARNGGYYAGLRESLLRLGSVKWTMVRTRWSEKEKRHKGDTTTTGIVAEMRVVDQATGAHQPFENRELKGASSICITFVPSFAASIRDGLFQILDGELLARLTQPQARSLYRVLQAHRLTVGGSLAGELKFNLGHWFNACGLEGDRTDNARRTLDQAHEHLQKEGYLHSVTYEGRGKSGTVNYRFSATPEPQMVERLMERGVSRPVSEALAADHPNRIEPALTVIEERLASGWKPRSMAASVVDAVRNPAKWGYAASPARLTSADKPEATARVQKAARAEPEQVLEGFEQALPLERRRDDLLAALRGVGYKLNSEQQTRVGEKLSQGLLEPSLVIKQALEARQSKKLEAYLERLLS